MNEKAADSVCPRCGAPAEDRAAFFCACGYQRLDVSSELDSILESVHVGGSRRSTRPAENVPPQRGETSSPAPSSFQLSYESGRAYPVHQRSRLRLRLQYPGGLSRQARIILQIDGEGSAIRSLAEDGSAAVHLENVASECTFAIPFIAREEGVFTVRSLRLIIEPASAQSCGEQTEFRLADHGLELEVVDQHQRGPNIQQVHINTSGDVVGSDFTVTAPDRTSEAKWIPLRLAGPFILKTQSPAVERPAPPAETRRPRDVTSRPSPSPLRPAPSSRSHAAFPTPPRSQPASEALLQRLDVSRGNERQFIAKIWTTGIFDDVEPASPFGPDDQPSARYRIGDRFVICLYTDEPAFLTLINVGTSGAATLLLQAHGIPAGRPVKLNGVGRGHQWQVGGPPGVEHLVAWFTRQKIAPFKDLNPVARLTDASGTEVSEMLFFSASQRLLSDSAGGWSCARCLLNVAAPDSMK